MEDHKIEIKKLVLNIEGKEISLSVDKAQKLYDALGELFKTKVEVQEVHHDHYRRYPWYWCTTTVPNPANLCHSTSNQANFSISNNAGANTATLLCEL